MRNSIQLAITDTLTIGRRELKSYINSPTAFLVAALFLGLTGYYFIDAISMPFAEASAATYLTQSARVLGLWVPLITMRLLSEEEKLGTLELLQTAPIHDWSIVTGKFLAGVSIVTLTSSATLYYVVLLFWFGSPDIGPIITGYAGLVLYGCAAVSVGLFASALTSNQLLSAGLGLTIMLFLTIADQAATVVHGWPSLILEFISFNLCYIDFAIGKLEASNIIYLVTFAAIFIFLSKLVLEIRRWR